MPFVRTRETLLAAFVVVTSACVHSNGAPPVDPNAVRPLVITEKVAVDSDDPAIWIHPTDPSKSLILGTDKEGGLYTFDLDGKILADRTKLGLQRPNNVDIRQGVMIDGRKMDLAFVTERDVSKLRVFSLPDVIAVDGGGFDLFEGDPPDWRLPMGVGLYHRPRDGALFAIVSRKTGPLDGYLWQYRVEGHGSGGVKLTKVRQFGEFSGGEGEIEAVAVDDELGYVYYSDEWVAVRKYAADPDAPDANRQLASFGLTGFDEDREGISIYKLDSKTGYIIVSDQEVHKFRVFPREGTAGDPHNHPEIAVIPVSATSSDGSEVTSVALAPNFPNGLFVAMSDDATFHLYRWEDFAGPLLRSRESVAEGRSFQPMSFLAFGDHGYHFDYMDPEDIEPPRNLEEAIAFEREEWREDKRPPAEFATSSLVVYPPTGGYVSASGMMPVATAMKSYCASASCDAGLMLGDNIYPDGPTGGADGRDDAKRFDDILLAPFKDFGNLAPDFRIYATLGNHDWRTSREAAMSEVRYLETTPPFYMDGIIYSVKPPAGRGDVELFVLDTEVLLAGTTVYEDGLADDGSELPPSAIDVPEPWTKPQTDLERGMAEWLERSLRESDARWKIVIGHHPIWSSAGSKYEEAKVMRRLILPALCRYADMYIAGHEHTLELHTDTCEKALPGENVSALPHIVSGAAAKHRPLNTWFMKHQANKSPELTTIYAKGLIWGFVHLTLEADQAIARVITTPNDGSGVPALELTHRFTRRSEMWERTNSESGSGSPLTP